MPQYWQCTYLDEVVVYAMINCFAYVRVSTVKQGEHGVSLQEQRAAIEAYASRRSIRIVHWFEERVTAAKHGRPLFSSMLKRLRKGDAAGVVIHKIDRSARNLRDWAALGDLIDAGVAVHFANESVDLQSRGGRLAADIQAVVASDYVRNLREETLKGIYGRLKQGLYPFAAPLGYIDNGGGKLKTVDAQRGPLITRAFELYATGRYNLDTLRRELFRLGLSNRSGRVISHTRMSAILNDSFYIGLITIGTTGESFPGKHVPIVDAALFRAVQARLAGRVRVEVWRHDFALRGLFHCSLCGRCLTGERQKGRYVYYRCHTRDCPTKAFREEVLEAALFKAWPRIAVSAEEFERLQAALFRIEHKIGTTEADRLEHVRMQLHAVKERLTRLVDAMVDGHIEKDAFNERRKQLLEEQRVLEVTLARDTNTSPEVTLLREGFELACSAQQSYLMGNAAAKREMAIRLCSNLSVAGKNVVVEPHPALRAIAKRRVSPEGDPHRTTLRTSEREIKMVWRMWRWAERWVKRQERSKAA